MKQRSINKLVEKLPDVISICLSQQEWKQVEFVRVGKGNYEQLIHIDKQILFRYLGASSKMVQALHNEKKALIRILDPLMYCLNLDENLSNVLDAMEIHHTAKLQDLFGLSKKSGKSYTRYLHEPLRSGLIRLTTEGQTGFFGYFTIHKPAKLISETLDEQKARNVKRSLKELHDSNIVWPICRPPGIDHETNSTHDYLLCDPNSGEPIFLDLEHSDSLLDKKSNFKRVDDLVKVN